MSANDQSNETMQGMWVGPSLSVMEQLSISSFLANGHQFHLYVYADVANVPAGTTLCDGNEILPEASIFRYRDNGSYAGFSNFFRYDLLLQRGGWWVDLDTICLKSFDFESEYVIGTEPVAGGGTHPISGVLKAPAGSELMAWLSQVCHGKDPGKIIWGETGPRLVAEAVKQYCLEDYVQPYQVFCPVGHYEWGQALDPAIQVSFDERTRAVHLWNEVWRRNEKDKDARYDPNCLYEKLKARYL